MKHRRRRVVFGLLLMVILTTAFFNRGGTDAYASAYVQWNDLPETRPYDEVGDYNVYYKVTYADLVNNSYNQTIYTDVYMTGGKRHYNDISWIAEDASAAYNQTMIKARITYGRKFCDADRVQLIAATDDTATSGGSPTNDGLTFYYCLTEWDAYGNLLFDSDWSPTSDIWELRKSTNGVLPPGVEEEDRLYNQFYFLFYFRYNNSDPSLGSGTEPIDAQKVMSAFKNMYVVYDDFFYLFDANGGTVEGGNRVQTKRFGIQSTSAPADPVRAGYDFTGWKIVSEFGKQTGRTYTTAQLNAMLSDGLYYSSLFGNTCFEAQWKARNADCTVEHYVMDGSGNYPAAPVKSETKSLQIGKSYKNDFGMDYFVDTSLLKEGQITASWMWTMNNNVTSDSTKNVVKVYYDRTQYPVIYDVEENYGAWNEAMTDTGFRSAYAYSGGQADLTKKAYREGWEFIGWNTDKNATTALDSYTVGTQGVTLYAIYKKTVMTTFVDSAGTRTVPATMYNKQTSAVITTPYLRACDTWENVTAVSAVGWSAGSDVELAEGAGIKYGQAETVSVTKNGVYYGLYRASATLSYDTAGGKDTPQTAPVTATVYKNAGSPDKAKGESVILPTCERERFDDGEGHITEYILKGWSDGTNEYPAGSQYTITQNGTLTAMWQEKSSAIRYTIEFNMNGGQNGPAPIETEFGTTVTLPEKGNRVGFTFESWNTKPDGSGVRYEGGAGVKNLTMTDQSTVTLYAQWKQKSFMLVKIGSSRYGATLIRRTEGDDEWFNTTGKITLKEWDKMTQEEKDALCVQKWHIAKDGTITRVK